jgi:hypothetical protein
MYGAREAMAGGISHIEQQIKAIEQAVISNPGLAFDLAKTLIESICRTILKERSIPYSENDDLPKLFKTVNDSLPLLPLSSSSQSNVRKSIAQTLNGLHTTIQGICELRNQCGFASHGSGEPRPPMEAAQALLTASAADAVVGFLYRMHYQDRQNIQRAKPFLYKNFPNFNEWIDEQQEMIRIFDLEFLPSDVLFTMDQEGYRAYLSEFGWENDGSNVIVDNQNTTEAKT